MSSSPTQPAILRRIGLRLVLGLALLVTGVSAGSAQAAITGLQQASATSATNSTVSRSATASCPGGKQVTGAAGGIVNGQGQVMLRQVRPDAGLTSVTATAHEDQNGFAGAWAVRAVAICAPAPAGLERVSLTSGSDSSDKGASVDCPTGKRLLGMGAELAGGAREVALNDIIPTSTLNRVTAFAVEDDDGTTGNWSVTAYGICSNAVAGFRRVVVQSLAGSPAGQSAAAECPDGKQLTGVGAQVAGGGGDVILDQVQPSSLTGASAVALEDEDGTAADWVVSAIAICADAAERVVGTSPNDSLDKGALATCPAGKQVTGMGGDITGGGGQVLLDDIVPSAGLTDATVFGFEDATGFTGNWRLRSYAICAPPMPGLELLSLTTTPSSPLTSSVTGPACPAGKSVVGVGGDVTGGNGEVGLTGVRPSGGLTRASAVAHEDGNGFAGSWSLTVHAICANTPAGLTEVVEESDPASDPAGATARCPPGTTLLGAGGQIDFGQGQVVLDDLRPNAPLTNVTVTGLEDEDGFGSDWILRAHAICANP